MYLFRRATESIWGSFERVSGSIEGNKVIWFFSNIQYVLAYSSFGSVLCTKIFSVCTAGALLGVSRD